MTCLDAETLELGTDPGDLRVIVVLGASRWRASLILTDAATGDPIAWPEAPVLEFGDDVLDATATLGADAETSTSDSQANWDITDPDEVALLTEFLLVRLTVEGEPWFLGVVECRS